MGDQYEPSWLPTKPLEDSLTELGVRLRESAEIPRASLTYLVFHLPNSVVMMVTETTMRANRKKY